MNSGNQWCSSSSRTPTTSRISSREYKRIFDAYVHEYLRESNYHASARFFRQEAQVEDIRNMLSTESPGTFLFDWWTFFYDAYSARHDVGQENQTAPDSDPAMFSQGANVQAGQSSSMYDLPPLPSALMESATMPLVSFPGTIPPFWSTHDGAPVPAHHELLPRAQMISVTNAGAIPPYWPTPGGAPELLLHGMPVISQAVAGAGVGAGPSHWPIHDGAPALPVQHELAPVMPLISAAGHGIVPYWQTLGRSGSPRQAPPQAPTNVDFSNQPLGGGMRPFGSPNAVVLTPGNVSSVGGPSHLSQPRPPRRGRRGKTVDDPINIESPMSPPAYAPRGTRPRLDLQPASRGTALSGAQEGLASSSRMVAQMPRYSGSQLYPDYQINAAAPASADSACVVPAGSLGMNGHHQAARYSGPQPHPPYEILNSASVSNISTARSALVPVPVLATATMPGSHAHTLKSLTEMLASTSRRRAAERDAVAAPGASASGQSSQGRVGSSCIQSSSAMIVHGTVGMSATGASVAPSPSTQAMPNAEPGSGAPMELGDVQAGLGAEENAEVSSSTMPDADMPEGDADADNDDEEDKEDDDTDVVRTYLNDNDGTGNDTAPDAPEPPQTQQQASNLIVARDEASGLEFKQEACLESNLLELWCCDFSSTGKFLACAGADRKVIVWSMGTFSCVVSEERHDEAIADIRFNLNSPIFATASFDRTIRIWDATKPEKSLMHLKGHAAKVTSVDFHPQQSDILSSCDGSREIRFWNLASRRCVLVTKGGSRQVRFQSQRGKHLAAAAGNTINILDSETGNIIHSLKGHIRPVECMCWDASGRYLASASQDSLHIWSVANWCTSTHKLTAESGQRFKSCIFHPAISQVVIVASDKNVVIWNPVQSPKTLVVAAHESTVTGLTSTISTDIIATASVDGRVKLWK